MIATLRASVRGLAYARLLAILQLAFVALFGLVLSACGGDADHPIVRIVAQPADQSAVAGQSATFGVVASGPATYQWLRLDGGQWTAVAGATQASYTMTAVQPADDGASLRVVVTNADNPADAITSSTAALTVTAASQAPAISVQPADVSVSAGLGGSISVTASGTALAYQWQRSADGTNFTNIDGATAATLALAPVQASDDGAAFRVVITNAVGSVTSAVVHLTVTPALAAPTFTTDPADVSAVAGRSATFTVAVTGTPAPTLAWQSSTDGATWTTVAGATSASLVLSTVATNDSGKRFRAVATNGSGSVESAAATLTVTPAPAAPTITAQPAAKEVGIGATPTFHAAASGVPTPTWQWQLSVDGGATFANVNGATAADFTLGATTLADTGHRFRAVATNASGTATTTAATLTVIAAPTIARQPTAQASRRPKGSSPSAASSSARPMAARPGRPTSATAPAPSMASVSLSMPTRRFWRAASTAAS